ncbi:MAG TPA: FtsX-like permease family protein [Pirellulaceae bacterium]
MYKLLLCSRYLRTRYIAWASIVSVTLGVATMIVVNSVMAGFQSEMYKRLHGILSDVVVEAHSLEGIESPAQVMSEIRSTLGEDLEALTANIHIPAMLSFPYGGQWITKQVNLIGIDRETYSQVSDFGKYLLHPANRRALDFQLRRDGYDDRLGFCGWPHRREVAERTQVLDRMKRPIDTSPATGEASTTSPKADPFAAYAEESSAPEVFDASREQFPGIVLGIAISNVRQRDAEGAVQDFFLCRPGDDVKVTFPSSGTPPKAISASFTVIDFYESKMSEYDAGFAFISIEELQKLRGMVDPSTGIAAVTAIQIKLKPEADLDAARNRLQARFPAHVFPYHVQTWRDMQGPLLSAVQMETTILNILLFLIIAVAGFGILATFYMIVVEKTRDIGILKALGAANRGILSIFLGYGLSLGIVGATVGVVLGQLFVSNINRIARLVEWVTGREVFDPTIYYFQEIPTIVHPWMVVMVFSGAIAIAVLASILPAMRAASLHPVRALRYE